MNILDSIRNAYYGKGYTSRTLAADTPTDAKKKRTLQYTEKAVSRVRQDIGTWNIALQTAQSDEPKNFALQLLLNEVSIDALLTSQVENRVQQIMSRTFKLKNEAGDEDEEQTTILKNLPAFRPLSRIKVETIYYGYNLCELSMVPVEKGKPTVDANAIPRENVVPKTGKFYPDYSDDKHIDYRLIPEFGTYVLEFNTGTFGLLNKAVPHVVMKRFAQSCWSELCEIYGIPPRVLKTNTQDDIMLKRAEKMMTDMGAASWFIIDDTENMEWATGTSTDGGVYKNLINLCSNEISLLISGAIIGQDTKHGNLSKETASQQMLMELTQGDFAQLEDYWNGTTIPALVKLGILKPGLRLEYDKAEDIKELWEMTLGALPFFTVDGVWVKDKFGIEITGERAQPVNTPPTKEQVKQAADGFFI